MQKRFQIISVALVLIILTGAYFGRNILTGHRNAVDATKSLAVQKRTVSPRAKTSGQVSSARLAQIKQMTFQAEATAGMRRLVDSLVDIKSGGAAWTPEQAADWKKKFQQLLSQGDLAVPAIREFLAKNVDYFFGADGTAAFGYTSARMAMIDALTQIGSLGAEAALDDVLQSTADPREIAQIAQDLEKLDPGVYQGEIADAARQVMDMAAKGSLPGLDVAPLFQVLQQYGGTDAAMLIAANINQWNYYSTIALTGLSDGAGVPSLVQIANGVNGTSASARTAAWECLAGIASQSPDAQQALIAAAQANSLSSYDWTSMVPYLAGDQMVFQNSAFDSTVGAVNPNDVRKTMISSSNESFFIAPLAAMTPDQINQQQTFINQMLAVTTNPAGIQALQQAKTLLQNRLVLVANSPAK